MGIGYFITGTDTGVGKTRVGTAIAYGLARRGLDVRVRKPVESGCPEIAGVLQPQDADALRRAAGEVEPLERVCRVRLCTAVSPERAAALEGVGLDLAMLRDACLDDAGGDVRLVEGAGGFCSPVAAGALNADLAAELGLPVVLVAADRLGVINHALLTLEAVERRGLVVAALVLSRPQPGEVDPAMDNAGDLARWSGRRVHVLPHGAEIGEAAWMRDSAHLAALVDDLAPR
jgi:dethiobiotin synthetase